RWAPTPFMPGVTPTANVLGAINVGNTVGGINWPGASFDPETATFYGQANNSSVTTTVISEQYLAQVHPANQAKNRIPIWEAEPPAGMSGDAGAGGRGRGGRRGAAAAGAAAASGAGTPGAGSEPPAFGGGGFGGRGALTQGLEGLPIVKPPYGVLTAIDLNTG